MAKGTKHFRKIKSHANYVVAFHFAKNPKPHLGQRERVQDVPTSEHGAQCAIRMEDHEGRITTILELMIPSTK